MLPPSAMPPGSISMTMKAPGVGTAQGDSVFDGKLVNRGWLVLRLKMSGAEKSMFCALFTVSFSTQHLLHLFWSPSLFTTVLSLSTIAVYMLLFTQNSFLLNQSQLALVFSRQHSPVFKKKKKNNKTKVNWFHVKIKQQKDKKWCAAESDNNNKDNGLQLFQVCLTVVEMKVCHPHWSWENKAIKPKGRAPQIKPTSFEAA